MAIKSSQTLVLEALSKVKTLTPDEALQHSKDKKCNLICHQSNAEHELVDLIHSAKDNQVKCIIINPGALTHSSIALRDALTGVNIPFIEVHISNIYAREDFRQKSYLSDIAEGVISGLGVEGYELALVKAMKKFN